MLLSDDQHTETHEKCRTAVLALRHIICHAHIRMLKPVDVSADYYSTAATAAVAVILRSWQRLTGHSVVHHKDLQ